MKKQSADSKKTLERVVARAGLFGVFFFLLVMIVVESFVFYIPALRLYKREMKHEGDMVIALLGEEYLLETYEKARNIYYTTPEAIRSDVFSEEYKQRIRPMLDDTYKANRNMVSMCREKAGLMDIAFVFFDDGAERLVFVMDGNDKNKAYLPAQWLSNENGNIESMATINATMRSSWFLPISYADFTGWSVTDYRGIYDDSGKLVGYITTMLEINSLVKQMLTFLSFFAPIMALLTLFAANYGSKWIKKRLLTPIGELTEKARQYNALSESGEVSKEPVFERLKLNTGDEIEELWGTMVDMEEEVSRALEKARVEAASKEKIATQLEMGRKIQMGALPMGFDEFGEGRGFSVYASMAPAKEISGDFYDFFNLDETHACFVIADVSDKGVPAALFMMTAKAVIRGFSISGKRPSQILAQANNKLCQDNPNLMFLTAWLGIMDITTGEVVAANAGHEYPFVTGDDGRIHQLDDPHGVVIGGFRDMEYEDYTFRIPKGGILFVYTDGVAEAINEQDEMFGMERLSEALDRFGAETPRGLADRMKAELDTFKGGAGQFDDITMLAVRFGE
jgi:sigma-B regulation protein RsbU (phosphoserine phosphatase)